MAGMCAGGNWVTIYKSWIIRVRTGMKGQIRDRVGLVVFRVVDVHMGTGGGVKIGIRVGIRKFTAMQRVSGGLRACE